MREENENLDLSQELKQSLRPHHWIPSRLGHGEHQCTYCLATNREIAVIGDINFCPSAPEPT